jgi:RNA polymerase sigma factor (sigma-70 family)
MQAWLRPLAQIVLPRTIIEIRLKKRTRSRNFFEFGARLTANPDNLERLLARVAEGSQAATSELIASYGEHVRAVVRSRLHSKLRPLVDSDDFLQSMWGSVVRIGPRLADIHRADQLIALLSKIARNKVIDQLRRRTLTQKHRPMAHGPVGQIEASQPVTRRNELPSASQVAIARERWEKMLEDEPPKSQEILQLRLSGCTYQEIASALEIHERTVRRTLARLAEKDREELD